MVKLIFIIYYYGLGVVNTVAPYNYHSRVKAIEAESMLSQVYALEKNHFFMYSVYSDNLDKVNFEQEPLIPTGGQANYLLFVEYASQDSFLIKAVSVTDFDGDGQFNIWQIDQNKTLKEIQED